MQSTTAMLLHACIGQTHAMSYCGLTIMSIKITSDTNNFSILS